MTTNVKTKNNQNCQNIELYGSPTTKELKKKHSFRLVGEVEMGWGGKDLWQGGGWWGGQGGGWWTGQSHICMQITGRTTGSETHSATNGFSAGK